MPQTGVPRKEAQARACAIAREVAEVRAAKQLSIRSAARVVAARRKISLETARDAFYRYRHVVDGDRGDETTA